MGSGEILTRVTIWAAVAGYAAGAAALALSRERYGWESAARLAWTVACVGLLAHAAAYLDTARQTEEVFGLNWGGGLYVNYALLAGWVLDVTWWWAGGLAAYRRRPRPLAAAWHGFLIFIIFNATVVFKTGPARWAGLCLCAGLCLVWWLAARGNLAGGPGKRPLTVAED